MKIIWSWIIIIEKRILLIKRKFNKKQYPNYWAIPWWWAENNENWEETSIREVKEETWLDFIPTKLFIKYNDKYCEFYRYIWTVSWKIIIQEEECDWYWWFTFDETKKLLLSDNMKKLIEKLHEENYF